MRGEGGRNLSALLKAECTPASLGFLDSSIVEELWLAAVRFGFL